MMNLSRTNDNEEINNEFTHSDICPDELIYALLCTVWQVNKYYDQYIDKYTLAKIMEGTTNRNEHDMFSL